MIGYDQIAEACRYMDAQADEGIALEEIARQRGVETDGLLGAANQRVLRIAAIMSGKDPRTWPRDRKSVVDLGEDTMKLLQPLQLAFIDGFIAGRSASDPADRVQRFPKRGD
jgi:hypothetical protein